MYLNYAYNFAEIDPDSKMCISVVTTSDQEQGDIDGWVEIPVYDIEHVMKYYINGAWYEDPNATIPWQSSLL